MSRGKSASPLSRSERLEHAFDYFRKGYNTTDVARTLKIHPDTARSYRIKYEDRIQEQVAGRPDLLSDVLGNTLRVLEETDLVKKDAWRRLGKKRVHYCEECGDPCGCEEGPPASSVTSFHGTILKSQEIRIKVFGLLGVKQEYFTRVQEIEALQRKILDFMATDFCLEDRKRLEAFLGTALPELMEKSALPVIDGEFMSEDYVTN